MISQLRYQDHVLTPTMFIIHACLHCCDAFSRSISLSCHFQDLQWEYTHCGHQTYRKCLLHGGMLYIWICFCVLSLTHWNWIGGECYLQMMFGMSSSVTLHSTDPLRINPTVGYSQGIESINGRESFSHMNGNESITFSSINTTCNTRFYPLELAFVKCYFFFRK